jgi:hypothetical protein
MVLQLWELEYHVGVVLREVRFHFRDLMTAV